jgi:hypothetical protein
MSVTAGHFDPFAPGVRHPTSLPQTGYRNGESP